jgi:hypothetical protein
MFQSQKIRVRVCIYVLYSFSKINIVPLVPSCAKFVPNKMPR